MEKNHTVTAVPAQQLITTAPATILCNCIPPNNKEGRKDGRKSRAVKTSWWCVSLVVMRFKEEVVDVVVTLLTQKQQPQSCF